MSTNPAVAAPLFIVKIPLCSADAGAASTLCCGRALFRRFKVTSPDHVVVGVGVALAAWLAGVLAVGIAIASFRAAL